MKSTKPSAAELLTQQLNPAKQEPPRWYDLAIEHHRRHQAFEDERKARQQAEEEERKAPQTVAGVLAAAIASQADSNPGTIPLNGAAVLRAALAGAPGTINSEIVVGRNE